MAQPQIVIDEIIALAATGLSRSVIAGRVGLSRSIVIGILWRRGEKPVALVEAKPRQPRRAKAVKPVEAVLAATNVTPIRLRDLPVETSAYACTWANLDVVTQCCWPVGNDLWCGDRKTAGSYCRHLHARSVLVDVPRVFAAKCPRQLLSA
jgi:hypothetical protein